MLNGQTFRELRLRKGFTVQSICAQSGLCCETITELERGRRERISDKALVALAKVFGMDPLELEKIIKAEATKS